MPLIATRGAASAQGFGEFAQSAAPVYIEDVFSTYLYTGNGTSQTITNGIDLSGKGGLVWQKRRSQAVASSGHNLADTVRGADYLIHTQSTSAQTQYSDSIGFTSTGFTIGSQSRVNLSDETNVAWTFRKAKKFFDVVTYTGNGSNRTISHNLGSVPGCIIVKRTDTTGAWQVYHRANTAAPETDYLVLNTDAATADSDTRWNDTLPTSTEFSLGTDATVNANSATYVAYLFAHDAGGFGDAGSDSIIKCGSFTSAATTGATVTLDWEPQWVLIKRTDDVDDWNLLDNMRGWSNGSDDKRLYADLSSAEGSAGLGHPTATGFSWQDVVGASATYIYIAIRRGPMKTPTSGTSVFDVGTRSGSASVAKTNSSVLTDLAVIKRYTSAAEYWAWTPRLVGNLTLQSNSTDAELTGAMATNPWDTMTGAFVAASNGATNTSTLVDYSFRRAPGFFDEVCYTGTGSATTFSHNLGVVPELMIIKSRSDAKNWGVYVSSLGNGSFLNLNTTSASGSTTTLWNSTSPTSLVFTVGTALTTNESGTTYVAYLFASVNGVSKVGSYTGTGTTLQVNCGFTAGARFVLIKRTDSTGDWYVWDSARGIVAGNDPYLLLNSTAAEVTNTDYVDTYSAGFEISSTAPAAINANGGTFIFLAVS